MYALASSNKVATTTTRGVAVRCFNRRQVALVPALTLLVPGLASAAPMQLENFTNKEVKETVDRYQIAADDEETQATRDGITEAKSDLKRTTKEMIEQKKLLASLGPYLEKDAWWEASSVLRGKCYTLGRNINILASTKGKDTRKQALAEKKVLFTKIAEFDLACGSGEDSERGDKAKAKKSYGELLSALDKVYSTLSIA